MNSKNRKTLEAVFEDPVRSDVEWKDIETLFRACGGTITNRGGSRVNVVLNDTISSFHRPHPERVTDKGALKSVRRFLITAGFQP
jgi:hypothetical protein